MSHIAPGPSPGRPALAASSALLLAVSLTVGAACGGGDDVRANVVLMTLDTTRADHLSCYGYELRTSPSLDGLARESVRYTRAFSVSSWTLPTHASLFTGKFPTSHGARYDPEGALRLTQGIAGEEGWDGIRAEPLGLEEATLAQLLRDRGYETAGFVGGPWMKRVFGLDRGFDHYDDAGIEDVNGRPAAEITDAALAWLERRSRRPFFLFLNYYDPHGPYLPPPSFRSAFVPEGVRDPDRELSDDQKRRVLYDGEILYMDLHIGRLLAGLRERGAFDDTWIVVTSDHGELLGENQRWGHGHSLTQAELHIPLLVKEPGAAIAGRVDDGPIQQPDVFAMVLAGVGIRPPAGIQGGLPGRIGHPVVAEVSPLPGTGRAGDWRALLKDETKYVRDGTGVEQLFRLEADPTESVDLAAREPRLVTAMREELRAYLDSLPAAERDGESRAIDEDTRQMLRNHGYLGE